MVPFGVRFVDHFYNGVRVHPAACTSVESRMRSRKAMVFLALA
jgi:hypothetical protein